ncbi:MAG: S-layer homology domain-containing protein, partial [Anaerotignum sp.]|nr:S-layer homology domain-containing protein [Anaerotignum sp.]
TAEDGTVEENEKVEVYGVPVNADDKLDVSFLSGKTNGYAVAIVQPTQDYGTLTIEADPTELKENKNASEYKVSYEAVYTLSQNLASLFEKTKSGDAEITLQLDENIAYVENSLEVTSNTYKKVSESYSDGVLTVELKLVPGITEVTAGEDTILTFDTTMPAEEFNKGEVLATTGEMLINISGSTDVTIPGNVAMTVMKKLDEAVVTFDPNGGEWDDDTDEPVKVTVKIGEKVDQPDTPSRSGYRFKGWEDEDGNKWDFDESVEKDMTLYARWDKKSNGGGGNHKPPVVEDEKEDDNKGGSNEQPEMVLGDVLNGGDHFAYVAGYPDGMVRPQQNITRAETAAIFYRLLNADVREANTTTEHNFSDVPAGEWYEVHVATLSAMGILSGRDNGTFDPNAPITRAEFAAICARFDKGEVEVNQTFKDIAEHWAKDEIEHAAARGWVSGYPDGSYLPEQKITRAEAMVIINRALCRVPETVDDLLPGMKTWVDNQPGDWYYLPVQEATNGHTFEYKDATYERWIELTDVFENNN